MEKNQLQKLQNRAARILTSSRHDADARPLLNTLGLKTIQDLIDTEINTMVFKALNGLAPEYLSNLFIRNSESSDGSEKYQYRPTTAKKNNSKWAEVLFLWRCKIMEWPSIPFQIKQASSLKVSKAKLRNKAFFSFRLSFYFIYISIFCY